MTAHIFQPGEHDEFVCGHVINGYAVSGPVEHVENADGSVVVDFPGITAEQIAARLLTYDPEVYLNAPVHQPFDIQKVMLHARLRALENA
jgi:hypothetical protein